MRQSTLSDTIREVYAHTARAFGTHIQFGGRTLPAMTVSLIRRAEHDLLLEGMGVNAAATDLRSFRVSPLEFIATGQPAAGDTVTWQGIPYTVLFVLADDLAGRPPVLMIECLRGPSPASSTADTAQLALLSTVPQQ